MHAIYYSDFRESVLLTWAEYYRTCSAFCASSRDFPPYLLPYRQLGIRLPTHGVFVFVWSGLEKTCRQLGYTWTWPSKMEACRRLCLPQAAPSLCCAVPVGNLRIPANRPIYRCWPARFSTPVLKFWTTSLRSLLLSLLFISIVS